MSPTVLHVLEALEGGTARHLVDVVTTVRSVEHEVVVPPERRGWATDESAIDSMRAAGATVHLVDVRRRPLSTDNVAAVRAVRRLVRQRRPAVVHGHSAVGGAVARLAAWGTGVPTCYTPNGLPAAAWATAVERVLGRITDAVVAVSPSEAAEVRDRRLVPDHTIAMIPNGIEVDAQQAGAPALRHELGIAAGVPLVGTISRLVPQKAPEVLVAAFERIAEAVPEAHFLLVGSGPLQPVVDAAVAGPLRGRLHQQPHIPDARRVLGELDVFVLASSFEGGPYAPLEAMAAGTPVVLTDVVGNRDTIESGRSGMLVPAGDPDALAAAVVTLLSDDALRQGIADAGRRRVEERFDVADMAAALSALYDRLASRASGTVGRRDRR